MMGAEEQGTRNWGKLLVFIVGVLVVVPFVVYAVPSLAGASGSYIVLSGSMQPTLAPGDIIVVYEQAPQTLEPGDIVTFRRGSETLVTHRIVGVNDRSGDSVTFETKGDGNEDPDPEPVQGTEIVGKVPTFSLPGVGTVPLYFPLIGYVVVTINQAPYAFLLVVGVLMIADEFRRFFRGSPHNSDDSPDSPTGVRDETDTNEAAVAAAASQHGGDGEGAVLGSIEVGTGSATSASMVFSGVDLRLSMVVLFGTAVYSGWVGVLSQSAIAISVAISVFTIAAAIALSLYDIPYHLTLKGTQPTGRSSARHGNFLDPFNQSQPDTVSNIDDSPEPKPDHHSPDSTPTPPLQHLTLARFRAAGSAGQQASAATGSIIPTGDDILHFQRAKTALRHLSLANYRTYSSTAQRSRFHHDPQPHQDDPRIGPESITPRTAESQIHRESIESLLPILEESPDTEVYLIPSPDDESDETFTLFCTLPETMIPTQQTTPEPDTVRSTTDGGHPTEAHDVDDGGDRDQ